MVIPFRICLSVTEDVSAIWLLENISPYFSLREIFSTDAGQLSDRLKSFAGQISICRTEGIFVVRISFSLLRFTGHLSDRLKVFAGQNEKNASFVRQSGTFHED